MHSPLLRRGSDAHPLGGRVATEITKSSSAQEVCMFPPFHLLRPLSMSAWTRGYVFYTLAYNPVLLCFLNDTLGSFFLGLSAFPKISSETTSFHGILTSSLLKIGLEACHLVSG